MLGEGKKHDKKTKAPRSIEGSAEKLIEGEILESSSSVAGNDAPRDAGDEANPFHALEDQLNERLGPLPPRAKRKVVERPQEAEESKPPEEAASQEAATPQEAAPQGAGAASAEPRALLFTPSPVMLQPRRSPLAPLVYAAASAAGLIVALVAWRIYEAENPVVLRAAAVSADPAELLRNMQALQQERAKVDALTRELAVARRQQGMQELTTVDAAEKAALERKVVDLQDGLRKAEALSGLLDTLLSAERRHNIDLTTQAAADRIVAAAPASPAPPPPASPAPKPVDGAGPPLVVPAVPGLTVLAAAASTPASVPAASPAPAPAPAPAATPVAAPAPVPAPVEERPQVVAAIAPAAVPASPAAPVATAPASPPPAAVPSPRATQRLLDRAQQLIGQGEIGAARAVLVQAAEPGGAPALFALAETYDPAVLASWGTVGTLGDLAKAREFYARALAAGAPEAKARLMALP